ncbi:MAG: paraquat-inducible protein A [Deltaproteobacteria bacterium]|nr:paraquat-inducible protein A [Deltaproteobacteria bacterium]
MKKTILIVCHECDLIHRVDAVPEGSAARCSRCGGLLYQHKRDSLERTLALTVTGLILFVVANAFPFLGFKLQTQVHETILITGVQELYHQGMWILATVVLLTTIVMPAAQIKTVFRLIQHLQPWAMMEVFMLGILVSIVKLGKMATIVPGIAAFAFMALILILAASMAVLDPHAVWERIKIQESTRGITVARADLVGCHTCHLLCCLPSQGGHDLTCPRCGMPLHRRKPNSIARTWALILAAAIFYVPANVLPITIVTSLGKAQADTIISGVIYFLMSGSWPIALVIFVASVFVPLLKLLALGYLSFSVQRKSVWRPVDRTKIYRMAEVVGRWSMVDVYVVTILVAMVNLGALATIEAGPAAVYFCGVVIITMLAAMSFDPRLIWDNCEENHE